MDFIGEFKDFLVRNWEEGGAAGRAEEAAGKRLESINYEGALKEAGVDKGKAYELQSEFLEELLNAQKGAYSQGIKDGFNLALHLLDMMPERRKEGSQ